MRSLRFMRHDGPAARRHNSRRPGSSGLGFSGYICDSVKDSNLVLIGVKRYMDLFLKSRACFHRRNNMEPFAFLFPFDDRVVWEDRFRMLFGSDPEAVPAVAVVDRFAFFPDLIPIFDKMIDVAEKSAPNDPRPDVKGHDYLNAAVFELQTMFPARVRYGLRFDQRRPFSLSYPVRLTGS